MDVEPKVYSLIKSYIVDDLKRLYPSIYFTSVDSLPTDSTYSHCVYIHELQGVEVGKDLENSGVNAYQSTFEVKVSVTEESKTNRLDKKQEVRQIAEYVAEAFKKLHFDIVAMPYVVITDGAYTVPMRFRRIIGSEDTFQ